VTQALPLFTPTEPEVMDRLRKAILGLRFKADAKTPVQWSTLTFEWSKAGR
jgi:hypothetical protein